MPPAIKPNAIAATRPRSPVASKSGTIASGQATARAVDAIANPRTPNESSRGAASAESAIDPRKIIAGHAVVHAAGTTADTNKSDEKISHPAAIASARKRGSSAETSAERTLTGDRLDRLTSAGRPETIFASEMAPIQAGTRI